jgi:hypothetical protein
MSSQVAGEQRIASFSEFWPFYVREHSNPINRKLHFVGSTLALLSLAGAVATANPFLLVAAPIFGYGFAWVGHFVFQKNKPATFKYPLYSFASDWVMYGKILAGKMDAEVEAAQQKLAA